MLRDWRRLGAHPMKRDMAQGGGVNPGRGACVRETESSLWGARKASGEL